MTKKQAGPIREAGDACMYGVRALKCAAGVLMSAPGPPLGSQRWSPVYFLYVSTCTHTFPGEMWRASVRSEEEMIKYNEAEKKSFTFKMHTDALSPQRSSH